MPTVISKTVVPGGGGDYTTLQAAFNAVPSNFVTADEQWDIELFSGDAGRGSFASVPTTDSTRYLRVFSNAGARHSGVYSTTNKSYIVRNGSDGAIQNPPSFTRIEGLQLRITGDDNNMYGIVSFGAGVYGLRIVGNIILADPSSTTFWTANCHGINFGTDVDGDQFAINNIIYGFNVKTGGGNVAIKTVNHDVGKTYCYNNTIVDCDYGIQDGYSDIIAKNNLVQADTTAFVGTFNAASNYNSTNLGTAPGANSRTGQTFSFVNAGGNDFHLASDDTGAHTFGDDLSGDSAYPFSTDIDGDTRSVWDIGADELFVETSDASDTKRDVEFGINRTNQTLLRPNARNNFRFIPR